MKSMSLSTRFTRSVIGKPVTLVEIHQSLAHDLLMGERTAMTVTSSRTGTPWLAIYEPASGRRSLG